jgi:two-component system, chemotaxis family, CheB/CheR fusion protein
MTKCNRNHQLNLLNNGLNNLLNSVNLPMVMVGLELNIRRFTPQAAKLLGVNASDVGRPITRLRLKLLDAAAMEQIMLNVISEVRPSHQRLRDTSGRGCELRVTPHRTSDNRIDGVVLSVLTTNDSGDGSASVSEGRTSPKKKATKTKKSTKPR